MARKDAFLFFTPSISFKIPCVPKVLKTYEEYGPGKPFNASTKKPASSDTTAHLFDSEACLAANDAISVRSSD